MNRTARISLLTLSAGLGLAGALFTVAPRPTAAAIRTPIRPGLAEPTFHIEFDYSKVSPALFNAEAKRQIESGARLIETFIGNNGKITIVVAAGKAAGALATGAPTDYEIDTDDKTIANAGGIEFGTKFVEEARDGENDISALSMHEILHCLGFTERSKAIAKNLKGGMYSGAHVMELNDGKPVPFDGAHFLRGFKDKHGIHPRMSQGGGDTLSIMDLAVLADLGYDIPLLKHRDDVDFHFPAAYYQIQEWHDGKNYRMVTGEGGNDRLEARDYEVAGKKGGYILVGGGGDDILISGPGNDIIDVENAMFQPATGKPGKNTVVLPAHCGKDTIMGFVPGRDVVYISPDTGVTMEGLEKAIKDAKQEKVGANGFRPGNWVLTMGDFEVIVSTGSPAIKLDPADFKIEEWKEK